MRLSSSPSNGRILEGDTAFGKFRVEWAADGSLLSQSMEIRTPPAPPAVDPLKHLTETQRSTVEAHRTTCQTSGPNGAPCEMNGGMTGLTVKCHGCGCAGLSLLHGQCKLGKWKP